MNLLNEASDYNLVVRNWNIVNDQSKVNYSVGNEIKKSAKMLKSNICDYSDDYILVRISYQYYRTLSSSESNINSYASFITFITKIDGTTVDGDGLDLVLPMYNLLEYSSNYSYTTISSCFFLKMTLKVLILLLRTIMLLNLSSIGVSY